MRFSSLEAQIKSILQKISYQLINDVKKKNCGKNVSLDNPIAPWTYVENNPMNMIEPFWGPWGTVLLYRLPRLICNSPKITRMTSTLRLLALASQNHFEVFMVYFPTYVLRRMNSSKGFFFWKYLYAYRNKPRYTGKWCRLIFSKLKKKFRKNLVHPWCVRNDSLNTPDAFSGPWRA